MSGFDQIDLSHAGPAVAGGAQHAVRREAAALLRLALPLAVTQLAQMAILATDTLMLGRFSKEALAAAALGNTVFFFAWLLGCGPANAVSPAIAHVLGENERATGEVQAVVRMGFWAAAMMAPPLLAVLLATQPILLLFGQQAELAANAGLYMTALSWGLPFAILFQVLRSFTTAVGHPLAALAVMVLAVVFNGLGDYALIFGHFGLPRLGLPGAGIASACSNLFSAVSLLMVCVTMPALRRYRLLDHLARHHGPHLKELFRLGLPIGLTTLFEAMLFNAAALMMGTFGVATLAAHQIAITIPSITFMVPLGIGLAATVRVGLAHGAGDGVAARRAGFVAIIIAALFMAVSSVLLLLFPEAIAKLWLPQEPPGSPVIALTVSFLHVAAAFQIVDGIQVAAAMSLRGLKDARAPMWIAGGAYWLCGFPLCALLGFSAGLQGFGVWLGLAFGLLVAAVVLLWRFNALSRLEIGAAQPEQ
ncbi:MAG: MATE family efflux transporter [Alphaproteobacteria bacterium]|nr:MATE family efflux transporter [Alphaproteobacteria bacterium]